MTDVILRISGMDCGACAVRIVRALQGLPGLREVSVSDTAGCARLTYDEMAVDLGEIARRVQRAGFDVPVGTAELRCPGADAGGGGAPAGGVRRAQCCARGGIPSR
ncbi:MAG: heavy-metal-associated domain-containing protein [Oscillospiraceae bacterium]